MTESTGLYEKLQKKYRRTVKKAMEELRVYKPQYETLIHIFAGLLAEHEILIQRLIDNDFDIEVETMNGGTRKSATATALERLQTLLPVYSDRLCLNPQAMKDSKQTGGKKASKLIEALSKLNEGGR